MTNTLVLSLVSTVHCTATYYQSECGLNNSPALMSSRLTPRRICNWDIITLHTGQISLTGLFLALWPGWSNKKIWYYLVIFSIIVKHSKFISLSGNKLDKISHFESNRGSVRLEDLEAQLTNYVCLSSRWYFSCKIHSSCTSVAVVAIKMVADCSLKINFKTASHWTASDVNF